MANRQILLGNEAIAHGLLKAGCALATSYPGTPASEIMATLIKLKKQHGLNVHLEWSINEKVAFEVALANSYAGRRSAVAMKQVGLNVAMDPFMSAAYTGVKGGFVVLVADDPGPHSSQTEQDSRFTAMSALLPVLDPSSPREAHDWIAHAFDLSEDYEIPVMIRPTTRVCHVRQDMPVGSFVERDQPASFEKNPSRWAATPKFRYLLHKELNDKIQRLAMDPRFRPRLASADSPKPRRPSSSPRPSCIVASGVALAHAKEILTELGLEQDVPLYQVMMPYPLSPAFRDELLANYERILILEETYPVIELQFQNRDKVIGRTSGAVPGAGELLPETVEDIIRDFLTIEARQWPAPPSTAGRRPTLCAGCPHRAAFYALKKIFRKGIYPSDIGCYTLGLNLGAVDTVLCMGAAISQAAGFYQAHRTAGVEIPPIVATIGDSTFFHAGIPALINAVVQDARFALVILDNSTTAMTGHQPTPSEGRTLDGRPVPELSIEEIVRACGVRYVRQGDPYDYLEFAELLKGAREHVRDPQGGVAVVISRHPCLMDRHHPGNRQPYRMQVSDQCNGCRYCIEHFECPALLDQGKDQPIRIDPVLCSGCGVCFYVCPHKALERVRGDQEVIG